MTGRFSNIRNQGIRLEENAHGGRLLVVVHYPTYGGPHNRALQLAAPLQDRGWHTSILLPDELGNAETRLHGGGVEVIKMPLGHARATFNLETHLAYFKGFLPQVLAIKRLIKERKFNAVLIGGLMNLHAGLAARLAHVPLVWQVVDSRTPVSLRFSLMKIVNRWADSVMFNGDRLMAMHRAAPSGPPKITYFPPVDTKVRFRVDPERRCRMRKGLGIPSDAPVVGTVANINPQKGIEYFVRSASIIQRSLPQTRFILVGSEHKTHPRYNLQLLDEVRTSGIPLERFHFLGAKRNVEDYYAAMDVKLITSVPNSEGTTTTGIEAMACGVPVVATDVGAVSEVVENGVTGFVVSPLDPQAIAHATLRLLQDPVLRRSMGEVGRLRAVERYDVEVCADTHIRAFEAALRHHRMRKR